MIRLWSDKMYPNRIALIIGEKPFRIFNESEFRAGMNEIRRYKRFVCYTVYYSII